MLAGLTYPQSVVTEAIQPCLEPWIPGNWALLAGKWSTAP